MSSNPPNEKYLELLQGVISRLSNCSFLLKGWSVTLVSGLLGLAAKEADRRFAVVAYLPVIAFWLLDGYYLRQERLFRALYDVAKDGGVQPFSMNTAGVSAKVPSLAATWLASTLLALYGPLLVATVVAGQLLP